MINDGEYDTEGMLERMERATVPSLREGGHAAAAEYFGLTWDVAFDNRTGLPSHVITYGATPEQAAVITMVGPLAGSGGDSEAAMAQISDLDIRTCAPHLVVDGDVDDDRLCDAVREAIDVLEERWPRVVELATAWDAQAGY